MALSQREGFSEWNPDQIERYAVCSERIDDECHINDGKQEFATKTVMNCSERYRILKITREQELVSLCKSFSRNISKFNVHIVGNFVDRTSR